MTKVLTRYEGHLQQLLRPRVRQLDGLQHPLLTCYGVTLQVGVLDNVRYVLRVARVEDVEEVGPVGQPALRQLVREVLHEVLRQLQLRPEVLHRELVVEGHLDHADLLDLAEHLLLREDLLEEVLREHRPRRHIELH